MTGSTLVLVLLAALTATAWVSAARHARSPHVRRREALDALERTHRRVTLGALPEAIR